MTYEQSLQNIENIKNFVLPYNCDRVVLNFKNEVLFESEFYMSCSRQEIDKLRADALNRNCPHAVIFNDENDLPILSYIDDNLIITFNIAMNETIRFHRKTIIDKAKLKAEFSSLIKQLKNT